MAADVDATRAIDELEALLSAGSEPIRCYEAMAILSRWRWDGDLDERSRQRAETLVRRYQRAYV